MKLRARRRRRRIPFARNRLRGAMGKLLSLSNEILSDVDFPLARVNTVRVCLPTVYWRNRP